MGVLYLPVCAAAQKGEDCLVCHDSKDLTTTREGKEVSLYVDGKTFSSSVHGSLACVDCHSDLRFAVFWGIAIIGSTGLTLWFPEFFTRFLPGWFLNVATIIHSDEALLATGFIFTVHFFNTHLRPEKFPMDIVVFAGRMSVEELRRDKPAEYEALVQNGELEKHLVEPYPAVVVKTIRVFAWGALALGFSMVIWIVYAMIFAYR
jgi:hypothetical protein